MKGTFSLTVNFNSKIIQGLDLKEFEKAVYDFSSSFFTVYAKTGTVFCNVYNVNNTFICSNQNVVILAQIEVKNLQGFSEAIKNFIQTLCTQKYQSMSKIDVFCVCLEST